MPDFWEFPTVSMGLGPIMAIYQARFNEYLKDRGIKDTSGRKVWAFLGDGECDEPETLGAITLAGREQLDNLIFVVNCNLQRLDGPVRGNGKIIQELEGLFLGAGWNVIKVVWGDDWDPLLEKDETGPARQADGRGRRWPVSEIHGDARLVHPRALLRQVSGAAEAGRELLGRKARGSSAAAATIRKRSLPRIKAAVEHKGQPTVILAKTIKGYGLGEAGEGRNMAHNEKKLNEEELLEFRTRFGIPISDDEVAKAPFYKPPENSAEMKYLRERRRGARRHRCPAGRRRIRAPKCRGSTTTRNSSAAARARRCPRRWPSCGCCGSSAATSRSASTSCRSCPTNRGRSAWKACSARSASTRTSASSTSRSIRTRSPSTRNRSTGRFSKKGSPKPARCRSFNAAGTAYSSHGINMIPFYIYYSMFGFQRIGDLIWAAQDMRAKGFLIGGTAGRTTLNGEGLQHQDGHSLLTRSPSPTCGPTTRPTPTRWRSSSSTACGGCTKRATRPSTT